LVGLGSSEAKQVPVSTRAGHIFPDIFYRVCELASPKNAQKRDKNIFFGEKKAGGAKHSFGTVHRTGHAVISD
jgi:hypothetical protein